MTSFADILKETNQLLEMQLEFSGSFLNKTETKQNAPCIALPATETRQGEQKIPVVKPNGITR